MQIKLDVPSSEWDAVETLLAGHDFSHDGGMIGFRTYTVTGSEQAIAEVQAKMTEWYRGYLASSAW